MVQFKTKADIDTLNYSRVGLHRGYGRTSQNNDAALVWLAGNASVAAERYEIYRAPAFHHGRQWRAEQRREL